MKLKRIVLFSLSLKKGGAENQLSKLALFLRQNTDWQVAVIYFVDGNDFVELFEANNISFIRVDIKKFSGLLSLIKYIRKLKPNVMISFMYGANIIARIIKLFSRIPLITSVRNNEISAFYRFLYRRTYKLDDCTTFNSNYALEKFLKEKLASPQKSLLVNNAVKVRGNVYIDKNNQIFTLVSLAHFRPQKDYNTLFKAIHLLKEEGVDIKLFVLGHLYDQDWPFLMIHELGIERHVELVGFTLETEKYLNLSDALILSSLWEGTPNAILEGMAHYLPVIASDIPGNHELVANSECGVLFRARDEADLKEKILQVMKLDYSQRKELGLRGNKYINEHFEESIVHKKWLDIISNYLR